MSSILTIVHHKKYTQVGGICGRKHKNTNVSQFGTISMNFPARTKRMQARCSPFSTRTVVEPLTSMSNDDDEDDLYLVWWKLQCLIMMMNVIIGGIVLLNKHC